jgi:hypothetical protein
MKVMPIWFSRFAAGRWNPLQEGDPAIVGAEDGRSADAGNLKGLAAGAVHAQRPDVALGVSAAATAAAATAFRIAAARGAPH